MAVDAFAGKIKEDNAPKMLLCIIFTESPDIEALEKTQMRQIIFASKIFFIFSFLCIL